MGSQSIQMLPEHRTHSLPSVLLAADVGGTHVRVGLIPISSDSRAPLQIQHYHKFSGADFPGLAEVLAAYLEEVGIQATAVSHAAIASAGHLMPDGRLISANLPWSITPEEVRTQLGWRDLRLVNDFEAVAHATHPDDAPPLIHLCGPATAMQSGPTLVLGPGTGLGVALRIPTDNGSMVLATETSQSSLTARTELELAVLRHFLRDRNHVPIEHALSGPGLVHIHHALAAINGTTSGLATPEQITTAATTGKDAHAHQTLSLFCGLLGSTLGDLALTFGAHGGIVLAGGFLPRIRDFLLRSEFSERFLDKGAMRTALQRIPVHLVEHGQLGVVGAARWYLDHQRRGH